jgi:hypothetical protein
VFKSTDAAGSWTAANAGLPATGVQALAIDAATPSTVYVATYSDVFKSTDSGGSWAIASAGLPVYAWMTTLTIDPVTPSTLYAGTSWNGLFKSVDSGGTWTAVNIGLPSAIYALAIDPTTPSILYVAAGGGLFKSLDAGGSWTTITPGTAPPGFHALVIDHTLPSTVYAGTYNNGGVFKSTDSGATWVSVGTGLPWVGDLALANDGKTVYAGLQGVWQLGAPVPTAFYTVTPCRAFDSRDALLGGTAPLGAGTTSKISIAGRCSIPSTAKAAAINVTVTAPFGPGHLTFSTDDTVRPLASTINYAAGQTRASNAVLRLGPTGALTVYVMQSSGDVHVIIDVSGYFE